MEFLKGLKDGVIGFFKILYDDDIGYLLGVLFGVSFVVISMASIVIIILNYLLPS